MGSSGHPTGRLEGHPSSGTLDRESESFKKMTRVQWFEVPAEACKRVAEPGESLNWTATVGGSISSSSW